MNKQEFTDSLRRELSGMEDYEYVNDTVSYYENYIETEIRKGTTQEDVLAELGDPRLIAKSIKAANRSERSESFREYSDRSAEETTDRTNSTALTLAEKFFNLPVWVRRATGGLLMIGGLIIAGTLISWLFPVLLVGGIAYVFYKFFRDNFLK